MTRAISHQKILTIAGLAMIATMWGLLFGLADSANAALMVRGLTSEPASQDYVAPMADDGVGAALYPCPRPVPPRVGFTYITYPPLAPQEFLYKHSRRYTTVHDDAPRTRTTVRWR